MELYEPDTNCSFHVLTWKDAQSILLRRKRKKKRTNYRTAPVIQFHFRICIERKNRFPLEAEAGRVQGLPFSILCTFIFFEIFSLHLAVVQSLRHLGLFATPWTAAQSGYSEHLLLLKLIKNQQRLYSRVFRVQNFKIYKLINRKNIYRKKQDLRESSKNSEQVLTELIFGEWKYIFPYCVFQMFTNIIVWPLHTIYVLYK